MGDGEFEVRRGERRDVAAVLALWGEGRSGHASQPDRAEDVERLVDGSLAALLVAERDGELIGALIAGWDGWRGNLYRLAVRAEKRRRGVGMELVRAGEEYLRSQGGIRITALVAFDDAQAGAFWDAAGYPQDEEIGRRVRNL